jgi:hypothetical protein
MTELLPGNGRRRSNNVKQLRGGIKQRSTLGAVAPVVFQKFSCAILKGNATVLGSPTATGRDNGFGTEN